MLKREVESSRVPKESQVIDLLLPWNNYYELVEEPEIKSKINRKLVFMPKVPRSEK